MGISWRDFVGFLRFCAILAVCLEIISVLTEPWPGWPGMFGGLAINFLFAVEIGGLGSMATPWVARRVWPWHPFNRWSAIVATLLVVALIGSWLAVQVMHLFGIPAEYGAVLVSAVPITLIVGVIATLFESSKALLQEAELALRTQQVERERAEKLAAEAQLASLTSRVQPHFLFNTLNSISALIRENPEQAEQTLQQLSSLLRGSLDTAQTIPIETEFKLVRDYLEIQRTRLGERLSYQVDWSAAALNGATVPPFAVQTVVENAVKHVAGQRQGGVALRLSARRSGNDVFVEVSDDGPGFDPDAVAAGHGLDNLQARLRALYGERAGLEFDRGSDGMKVRIRVPA